MFINEALSLHDAVTADGGHPDILGDGYLMTHNPVYRNIKLRARAIGSAFVEAWPKYLLMPFNELDVIVRQKKIPYVPSAKMLREIEAKRPGVFTTDEMRTPESYHLHEAAHVVAEDACAGLSLRSRDDQVLKTILCESFANTVDALACVPANNELHRFFIEQNCYMKPRKTAMEAMQRLIDRLGFRFTFMLTLSSYLHANFLRESTSPEMITDLAKRLAPEATLTTKLMKDALTISRLGDKLDPLFRVQTTSMYFKLIGFDDDIYDILDFDFMNTFAQTFLPAADRMCAVLSGS